MYNQYRVIINFQNYKVYSGPCVTGIYEQRVFVSLYKEQKNTDAF